MPAKSEIDIVATTYRAWRAGGPRRGEQPDVRLQKRVVALLGSHSWEQICQRVGISRYQLARWRSLHGGPARRCRRGSPSENVPTFVELAPAMVPSVPVEMEVRAPNGTVVRAQGQHLVDELLGLAASWAREGAR